jgi:hypothetical protein
MVLDILYLPFRFTLYPLCTVVPWEAALEYQTPLHSEFSLYLVSDSTTGRPNEGREEDRVCYLNSLPVGLFLAGCIP